MTPSATRLLQCMQYTFETVLMPHIEGDYQKSISLTMANLLRYTKNLVEQEGEMLWHENRELELLLTRVTAYLEQLPANPDIDLLLAKLNTETEIPDNGYPSVTYLNKVSTTLKQKLEDALGLLVKFPADIKQDKTYQGIREDIRQFLIDNITREDALITASFTSKRR